MNEENNQNIDQEVQEGNYYTPYNVGLDEISGTDLERYISHASGLPDKIDAILTGFGTAEFIEERLGVKLQLTTEQKTEITKIIRDVLLGDTFIGDMPTIISQKLNLDQNTSRETSSMLISELFAPAIEEIKKMQAANFPDRVGKKQNPPTAPQPQSMPQKQQKIPGEELPETGGNIIDLRNQK